MRIPAALLCCAGALCAQRFPEQPEDSEPIREQQYRQMDRYFTAFIEQSDARRKAYWSGLDFSSPAAFDRAAERYRRDWAEFLAVPDTSAVPMNPRRELVKELPTHTAYRVWVDTVPGVQSYGILLVPRTPGKKPGLIALHGARGNPEIVAGFLPEEPFEKSVYRTFGRAAAERGYVVWCPFIYGMYTEMQEPQEGPDARGRNILHKKAILTGRTLMGLEAAKIRRAVDYLASLPEVDPARIGMYGLSKGGHYTLYTAPLEPRLRAVVVSGWFNHRTRKLLAPKTGPGMFFITYPHRSEYYLKNLLDLFGDAELAWMIAPRALLIENGDQDGAVLIGDAREEFGRVREVYEKLGLGDKAAFAGFHGPHRIDGTEAFPFLDRWLRNSR